VLLLVRCPFSRRLTGFLFLSFEVVESCQVILLEGFLFSFEVWWALLRLSDAQVRIMVSKGPAFVTIFPGVWSAVSFEGVIGLCYGVWFGIAFSREGQRGLRAKRWPSKGKFCVGFVVFNVLYVLGSQVTRVFWLIFGVDSYSVGTFFVCIKCLFGNFIEEIESHLVVKGSFIIKFCEFRLLIAV
jgi:hypothetical protein